MQGCSIPSLIRTFIDLSLSHFRAEKNAMSGCNPGTNRKTISHLTERAFDRTRHGDDIKRIVVSQVRDPEYFSGKIILSACNRDAVIHFEGTIEHLPINIFREPYRRNRIRGLTGKEP